MSDEMENKMRLLQLLDRTVKDHATKSNLPNNLTGRSASGVGGQHDDDDDFNASDYGDTSDLGYGSDGGAELRKRSNIDFEDDSGVVMPDMPSIIDECFGVSFRQGHTLVAPPDHGLTISAQDPHRFHYFALTFVDCSFDSTGMTSFVDCQLTDVLFVRCNFFGVNHFANIIGSGLRWADCSFDNHWEAGIEHPSDKHFNNRVFKDSRLAVMTTEREARSESLQVKEQERELELLALHPRIPLGIHTEDGWGKYKSPGRGLVVKDSPEYHFYYEVYFISCTFDPEKPTIFDKCVLEGVTFKKCSFSGSRFENFYAKGLEVTACTFDDCFYLNQQRPDNDKLLNKNLRGSRRIGERVPVMKEKQLAQRLWNLSSGFESIYDFQESGEEARSVEFDEEYGQPVSNQREYQHPGGTSDEWDVATMGKGKGRAAAPGEESK